MKSLFPFPYRDCGRGFFWRQLGLAAATTTREPQKVRLHRPLRDA